MVDVSGKAASARTARAEARVRMSPAAQAALREATLSKGDAFTTAQIAGIMAAKQTANLIPLAHPLPLAKIDVRFDWADDGTLRIEAEATDDGADRRRDGGDGGGQRRRADDLRHDQGASTRASRSSREFACWRRAAANPGPWRA